MAGTKAAGAAAKRGKGYAQRSVAVMTEGIETHLKKAASLKATAKVRQTNFHIAKLLIRGALAFCQEVGLSTEAQAFATLLRRV
jgi:hypothetical protein